MFIVRKLLAGILPTMVLLVVSAWAASAPAASFDCKAARSVLEKDICGDPALSQADETMADVYRAQRAATPVEFRQRFLDSQRSWLSYVGPYRSVSFRGRIPCLRQAFKDRTEDLQESVRRIGPMTFLQAKTYAVRFNPSRTDRAFAHEAVVAELANPKGPAADAWNRMIAAELKDAAQTDEDPDDVEAVLQVSGASGELISTRVGTSYYAASLAHPQYHSSAIVWSLRLGRPLTLADLFKDVKAGSDRLAERAFAHFEPTTGMDGVTVAAIRDTLDSGQGWEATPKGLLLNYDPYAFGCYPCTGSAVVPWAELTAVLRADLPFVIKDLRD